MIENLHIGTSGWSYAHWIGRFYPAALKPANFLEYYADQFSCVELNASFYHTPLPKVVENWRQRTPDAFRFCVKVSRYITHRQKLSAAADALANFLGAFASLQHKLGPFLIQLPPGLVYESELAEKFYRLLQPYPQFRFAIEPRHTSWFSVESLQLMQRFQLSAVIADSGGIFPQNWQLTTDFAYLRWHGAHGLYYAPYSQAELRHYATLICRWLTAGIAVWGFFNNDAQAHAVRNARELIELVANPTT